MIPIAFCRTLAVLSSRQNRFLIPCIFTMLIWYLILFLKCKLIFLLFNTTVFNQHLCLFSLKLIFDDWCLHVKADAYSIFFCLFVKMTVRKLQIFDILIIVGDFLCIKQCILGYNIRPTFGHFKCQ
jgi:hypothetical protein